MNRIPVRKIAISLLLLCVSPHAIAEQLKIPVEITTDQTDLLTRELVFRLKEEVRNSSNMEISRGTGTRIQVSIVSDSEDQTGRSIVFSTAITLILPNQPIPLFLNHQVGLCGLQKIPTCAAGLASEISDNAEKIEQAIAALQNRQ